MGANRGVRRAVGALFDPPLEHAVEGPGIETPSTKLVLDKFRLYHDRYLRVKTQLVLQGFLLRMPGGTIRNMPDGSMIFCTSNNNLRQIPDVKAGLEIRLSRVKP